MDGKVIIGTALDTKQLEKDLKNAERQLVQYEKEAERLTKTKARYEASDNWQEYAKEKQMIEETIQAIENSSKSEYQKKIEIEAENQILQDLNAKYKQQVQAHDEILQKIQANAREQAVLKDKVKQTTEEYQRQKGFANIKDILKDVSKETSSVVNKVGRWALAVFGVRSAYMFIRQAMSTLSQYDDQMATNIEYIRYLLASSLKPLIETLINLAYQLLQYLNMIMQSWFGINLFANATTEEFMKQKSAMGGTSKAAKELQKTLSGFDEMNILQEDGSTKAGGGGGGITMPKLPKMDEEKPEWMQWIIDHKDEIISALTGIATALGLIKLGIGLIEATGIGLAIAGLVYAFEGFSKFDKDGTLKNLGKGIEGVGASVVGLAIAFSSLFTGIVGGVVISYGAIIKYWTEIKGFFQGIIDWFKQQSSFIHSTFGHTIGLIYDIFVENLQSILTMFDVAINKVKIIFKNVIDLVKNIIKGDFKEAGKNLQNIWNAVWDNILVKVKTVWQVIKNTISMIVIAIGENIKWNIKLAINSLLDGIEKIINFPINAINLIIDIAQGFGAPIQELPHIYFPRLAKGGIVNMPGKGVPVGNAIAGERGAEGVIPLTDSQQMELLGQSIGKYITINANITNTMNGRVISKELQKIQAENDFAFNK